MRHPHAHVVEGGEGQGHLGTRLSPHPSPCTVQTPQGRRTKEAFPVTVQPQRAGRDEPAVERGPSPQHGLPAPRCKGRLLDGEQPLRALVWPPSGCDPASSEVLPPEWRMLGASVAPPPGSPPLQHRRSPLHHLPGKPVCGAPVICLLQLVPEQGDVPPDPLSPIGPPPSLRDQVLVPKAGEAGWVLGHEQGPQWGALVGWVWS